MAVLEIDLGKIKQNTANIKKAIENIELTGVTKACQGDLRIARAMVDGGAGILAETHFENLVKLKKLSAKKMLLRVPLNSFFLRSPADVDFIIVSNFKDIKRLSRNVHKYREENKVGLILNIETGFGREGFEPGQVGQAVEKVLGMANSYYLAGFSTNTACGAPPEHNKKAGHKDTNPLNQLNLFTDFIRSFINSQLPTPGTRLLISGGNSSVLPWALKQNIPKEINQLRIGEAILLGHDTVKYKRVALNHMDAFKLKVEAVQYRKSQGSLQAILAIGLQDTGSGKLRPLSQEIEAIESIYSDYLRVRLRKGASIRNWFWFKPDYYALLALMGSPYVKKAYKSKRK